MSSVAAETGDPPAPAARGPLDINRADVAAAVQVLAACLALGLVIGVLWGSFAPRATATAGFVEPCVDEVECAGYFNAEAYFGIAAVVAGLAVAAIAYARRRDAGVALIAALAVGGAAGALVAARTGTWIGHGPSSAYVASLAPYEKYDAGLRLDTWALLLAWPIASLFLTFWLAVGGSDHDRERPSSAVQQVEGADHRPAQDA